MSTLICPNCGHQACDELAHRGSEKVIRCTKCLRIYQIIPLRHFDMFPCGDDDTPLYVQPGPDGAGADIRVQKGGEA